MASSEAPVSVRYLWKASVASRIRVVPESSIPAVEVKTVVDPYRINEFTPQNSLEGNVWAKPD